MTSYHGGKQKIGKDIANAIYNYIDNNIDMGIIKGYCEPFCGMLGVYRHIYTVLRDTVRSNSRIKFLSGDYNKSLILMWKKSQKGWKPPTECSEDRYNKLKNTKKPSAEKGFIGHQYSYGGQYFKGYRGKYGNKGTYKKASKNVSDIAKLLKKVKFKSGSYTQFNKLNNFIIYCDPPYKDDKSSYYFDEEHNRLSFDHVNFWKWCLKMSKNNIIFVSEYKCPIKDKRIKKIYQKTVNLTGASPTNRKRVEKLYVVSS
jgi:site-specific DNA-adenine methylase